MIEMRFALWVWKKITDIVMKDGDRDVAYQLWGYIQACIKDGD